MRKKVKQGEKQWKDCTHKTSLIWGKQWKKWTDFRSSAFHITIYRVKICKNYSFWYSFKAWLCYLPSRVHCNVSDDATHWHSHSLYKHTLAVCTVGCKMSETSELGFPLVSATYTDPYVRLFSEKLLTKVLKMTQMC